MNYWEGHSDSPTEATVGNQNNNNNNNNNGNRFSLTTSMG